MSHLLLIQLCFVLQTDVSIPIEAINEIVDLQYLRGSLGGIRVLVLLLLGSLCWNVVQHLTLIARLVQLGQVLKFPLLLGRHCLKTEK